MYSDLLLIFNCVLFVFPIDFFYKFLIFGRVTPYQIFSHSIGCLFILLFPLKK